MQSEYRIVGNNRPVKETEARQSTLRDAVHRQMAGLLVCTAEHVRRESRRSPERNALEDQIKCMQRNAWLPVDRLIKLRSGAGRAPTTIQKLKPLDPVHSTCK